MAPFSSSPDPLARELYRPSLPDFLVALLFVKSKPRGLSSRDYLLQLRGNARDGARPRQDEGASRHVDATAYWRDSFIKSEETQLRLQARISELERQLNGNDRLETTGSPSTVSLGKRKRVAAELAEASSSRSQKQARTKATATALSTQDEALAKLMNEVERSESDVQGRSFLEHLYTLQEVSAQMTPYPRELATALCHTSSSICQLISAIGCSKDPQDARTTTVARSSTSRLRKVPPTSPDTLEDSNWNKLHAVFKAFPCLLKGLHKLDNTPEGRTVRGQVVWSFVKIFDDLLERICDLSAAQASETPITMPHTMGPRTQDLQQAIANSDQMPADPSRRSTCLACRERNKKCDQQVPTCKNCARLKTDCKWGAPLQFTRAASQPTLIIAPPENALRLCELAITLMAPLNTTNATDVEVLEGFVFLLLRRVGQGMKKFVFGFEEDEDSQEEGVGSTQPRARANPGHQIPPNQEVMEAQAPCLIWILEQTCAFTANLNPPASTGRTSNRFTAKSTTASLSTIARHRLQHTLATAIFGARMRAEFQPALEPHGALQDEQMCAQFSQGIKEHGVKDWFKHEVWRILGWDVLKGHLEFLGDGQ